MFGAYNRLRAISRNLWPNGRNLTTADSNAIVERIGAAKLNREPFPYFFADNVLPAAIFRAAARNWESATMTPEGTPGVWIKPIVAFGQWKIHELPERIRSFWTFYAVEVVPAIVAGTLAQYSAYLKKRYGETLSEVEIDTLYMMESRDNYFGHNVHRHYAEPQWIATNLIYIDDYGSETRGTTLFSAYRGNDNLVTAAQASYDAMSEYEGTFGKDENYAEKIGLVQAYKAPFRANGMVSFFETACSLHAGPTGAAKGARRNARKCIRMHLKAPARCKPVGQMEQVSGEPEGSDERSEQIRWFMRDHVMLNSIQGDAPRCTHPINLRSPIASIGVPG
jgi:hypothetical protein